MRLETYRSQRKADPIVGAVRAQPGAMTGAERGMQVGGQALTQVGQAFLQDYERAKTFEETTEFNANFRRQMADFAEWMHQHPTAPPGQTLTEYWEQQRQQVFTALEESVPNTTTTQAARQNAQRLLATQKEDTRHNTYFAAIRQDTKNITDRIEAAFMDAAQTGDMGEAMSIATEAVANRIWTEQYSRNKIQQASEQVAFQQAQAAASQGMPTDDIAKQYGVKFTPQQQRQLETIQRQYEQQQDQAARQYMESVFGSIIASEGAEEALELATNPRFIGQRLQEGNYSISDLTTLQRNLTSFVEHENNKVAVQQETAWINAKGEFETGATSLLQEGKFDELNDLINGFSVGMDGKYASKEADLKNTWRNRLHTESGRKRAEVERAEAIDPNPIAVAGLNELADGIWKDIASWQDLEDALNSARFGDEVDGRQVYAYGNITSDTPLIDDSEYLRIHSAARSELKSTQRDEIRREVRAAQDVIIGFDKTGFRFDSDGRLAGIDFQAILEPGKAEEVKNRFNAVNLYERSLREWLTENPDKTGREFYMYAERLRYEYWNKTQDDIEELNRRRQRELTRGPQVDERMAEPPDGMSRLGDHPGYLPRPKTLEEAMSLPPGTRFIDPQGIERIRPADE